METVFSTPLELVVACIVLACAQAVYVLLGFGAGLIAVGSLALLMPEVRDVVVMLLLVNLPAEIYVVVSSWKRIEWRGVTLIFVGIAVGIPLGAWLLQAGEPTFLLALLGAVLVIAGLAFLAAPRPRARRLPRWLSPPTGLISGVLTGLFGTGGPPLVFYYQLCGIEKAVFRGNLMAIFLLTAFIRVPSYVAFDLFSWPRVISAAAVLPAVLLGAWIGNNIHLKLEEDSFRRIVSVALVVIGIVLLVRQLG
jgi:uncharacterized membrane protein YfcA